jgi:HEPN domain-containing protein
MPSREDALDLYRKADEDIRLAGLIADKPEFSDEMFGFHLQQAVEKLLKCLLAARGDAFPFSHNLYELVNLCEEKGIELPADVDGLCILTPFATTFRYSALPAGHADPLDRPALIGRVAALQRHCIDQIRP